MNKNLKNEYAEMPKDFENKIASTLDTLENKKNPIAFSKAAKIIAIAAAVIAVLTVSGFAAEDIYKRFLTKEDDRIILNVGEITSSEAQKPAEYIKLNLGWLPDDIQPFEPPYKYHRIYSDGTESPGGLTFSVFTTETAVQYAAENADNAKELMIGDHLGAILSFNVDKQLLIFFDDMGYVLLCYVTIDMDESELIKIAENISLEETDKEHAFGIDTCIPGATESSSMAFFPDDPIANFEYQIKKIEEKYEFLKSHGYDEIAEKYKREMLDPAKEDYSRYLEESK